MSFAVTRTTSIDYSVLALTAVGLLSAWVFAPSAADSQSEHIGFMLRFTARAAFGLLLLAYIARPLRQLTDKARFLLGHRRYLGLAAALAHTVHFAYVSAYLLTSGEPVLWQTIVFGGMAFVLLWLMALTSNNTAQRRMGRWWRPLHVTGMHYAWLIFMQTFLGTAVGTGSPWAWVMVALGSVALALRLSAWMVQRFKRTA